MAERTDDSGEQRDQSQQGDAREDAQRAQPGAPRGAEPQGDGDDVGAEGVGRVGSSERGGQGGYGGDSGFDGGTTGSREGLRAGQGDSSQSPAGRSNDGGAR